MRRAIVPGSERINVKRIEGLNYARSKLRGIQPVEIEGVNMDFNLPEGLKMLERTVRRRYEV